MTADTLDIEFGIIRFRLISGLIRNIKPKEFYLCWVDNWFDSKWLNFSGKMLGALGVWKSEDVTIPPFNPNRIIGEGVFNRQDNATEESSVYKIRKGEKTIHPSQPSSENLNRKIKHIATDAVFIWANKNPETNNFGCIMAYIIKEGELLTFYVSFENKPELEEEDKWRLHKVVGTTSDYLLQLLDKGKSYKLKLDVD